MWCLRNVSLLALCAAVALPLAVASETTRVSCAQQSTSEAGYVKVRSARMLDEPDVAAGLRAELPIGTPVEVVCTDHGWARAWAPSYHGMVGWVRLDQLDTTLPTVASLIQEIEAANDKDAARELAEQLLALAPRDVEALESVIAAFERIGDSDRGKQVKTMLEDLLHPTVRRYEGEPKLVLVLDGDHISPLTSLSAEEAVDQGDGEFVDRSLEQGRAYFLTQRNGADGMATVTKKEELSCESEVAGAIVDSASGDGARAAILTNFPLTQSKPGPDETASPAATRTLRKLAARWLRRRVSPAAVREMLATPDSLKVYMLPAPKGGAPLLFGVAAVEPLLMPDRTGFSLLLLAEKGRGGQYRPVYRRFKAASGQEFERYRYLTYADLDSDGSNEIILSGMGYEWWWYEAIGRKKGRWQQVATGGGGGC